MGGVADTDQVVPDIDREGEEAMEGAGGEEAEGSETNTSDGESEGEPGYYYPWAEWGHGSVSESIFSSQLDVLKARHIRYVREDLVKISFRFFY